MNNGHALDVAIMLLGDADVVSSCFAHATWLDGYLLLLKGCPAADYRL